MSKGMEQQPEIQHCNLTLITMQGCGACKKLKSNILRETEVEEWGIDVLHIDNNDKYEDANQRFPTVDSVPSLVLECDGSPPQSISGVDRINRFIKQGLF